MVVCSGCTRFTRFWEVCADDFVTLRKDREVGIAGCVFVVLFTGLTVFACMYLFFSHYLLKTDILTGKDDLQCLSKTSEIKRLNGKNKIT